MPRSPGILPSDFAIGLRGSPTAHPCADTELGASCARPCGLILRPLAAAKGGIEKRGSPCRESRNEAAAITLTKLICQT